MRRAEVVQLPCADTRRHTHTSLILPTLNNQPIKHYCFCTPLHSEPRSLKAVFTPRSRTTPAIQRGTICLAFLVTRFLHNVHSSLSPYSFSVDRIRTVSSLIHPCWDTGVGHLALALAVEASPGTIRYHPTKVPFAGHTSYQGLPTPAYPCSLSLSYS